MIQGIGDFGTLFPYPDTGVWDPLRNTREFVQNMPVLQSRGLNAFTVGMQGGMPRNYSFANTGYVNTAFNSDGSLKADYMTRLKMILDKSNQLGMIVIVSFFYTTQVGSVQNKTAAVLNAAGWLHANQYKNVIVEIANECGAEGKCGLSGSTSAVNLISLVKRTFNIPVGNSLLPGDPIVAAWVAASDVILLHGNGFTGASSYQQVIQTVKTSASYRNQPIVFNEAGTRLFLTDCLSMGAGWGYYDQGTNNYVDGYQSIPVNWGINTALKQAFFNAIP